jgi:dTDP-4-amino-4,6-dideoxygalactose transaminase
LHEARFGGRKREYLEDYLISTNVSSGGSYVDQFKSKLIEFSKAKYAVAVMNETAALHIALLLARVEREDEVLVPTFTFVVTAKAIRYVGAEPHFADS